MSLAARSQEREAASFADGAVEVSFVPPAGLEPLSKDQIALAYEGSDPANVPRFVLGNLKQVVLLSVATFGENASEKELAEIKAASEAQAEKSYTDFGWLDRDWVTLGGRKWFRQRFKASTGGVPVVVDLYVTDWAGKYVVIKFSAPASRYESYREALGKSLRSIRLGMIATSLEPKTTKRPQRGRKP